MKKSVLLAGAMLAILLLLAPEGSRLKTTEKTFSVPQIPFNPKTYVCYRAETPLKIDGKMTEKAWQNVPWTDDFTDIRGERGPRPRFRTRVKMLWDSTYFYVAAQLEEPDVWATLKNRDAVIYHDNDFEVFVDPDGDTQDYYEFEMNALNTVWDLLLTRPYRDGGDAVTDWDIHGLKSAVSVQGSLNRPGDKDRGWTLEIAFPWKALAECAHKPAPPLPGEQWRVNFSRVEWRTRVEKGKYVKLKNPETGKPLREDNWVWSPQGLVNMHYPEMWGVVQFSGHKAAGAGDTFRENQDERLKWELRQVYYAERTYFLNHRAYSSQPPVRLQSIPGFHFPPAIVAGKDFFVATLRNRDGSVRWHIREDGRVWSERE